MRDVFIHRDDDKSRMVWFAGIAGMAVIVVVSNILVQYPINHWLTWGAMTYPICFLVTDIMNRLLGAGKARYVVYVGFVFGVLLSFWLAGGRIAFASGTAFLCAQLLDIVIFNRISKLPWWRAPLVSSFFASGVDTCLFFSLAFAGTGLPWITWALGDYGVKCGFAVLMLIPFGLILGTKRAGGI